MGRLTGLLLALPLAALVFMGAGCGDTSSNQTSTGSEAQATVSFNGSKFFPMILNVKPGDTVIFKNESTGSLQVQSNPHPTHTDNAELNIGEIAAGQSKTVKLNNKGVWGYHNHLNSNQVGSVIVQ